MKMYKWDCTKSSEFHQKSEIVTNCVTRDYVGFHINTEKSKKFYCYNSLGDS